MTSNQPKNTSEWQLYRVLQRANLLQYYDTFIAQGGDDVQQLCEAGEEEFLEIMALVGMASKPLHVRRLQKALQEWVANPAAFQGQVPAVVSVASVVQSPSQQNHVSPPVTKVNMVTVTPPGQVSQNIPYPHHSTSPINRAWSPSVQPSISPGPDIKEEKDHASSPLPTPVLVENQITSLADAAANLAKDLPFFDAKPLNMKKQINREIMGVIQQPADSPNRLEEIRKYAAIYGRFDSKRKNIKPMSMHEISVNEAAAQLCIHMPTLLTRREDLFPLARQVVRDSGYQYSKGHSRAEETMLPSAKRRRLDPTFLRMLETYPGMYRPSEIERNQINERISAIIKELGALSQTQEEFKKQIQAAQDRGDTETAKTLQDQFDQNLKKQEKLIAEQSDMKKMKKASNFNRFGYEDDDPGSDLQSGGSSPCADNSADGDDFVSHVRAQFEASKGKLWNDTLFDEGLRIAQQYGMADFAEELKGLQGPESNDAPEQIKVPTFNKKNGHSVGFGADSSENEIPPATHVMSDIKTEQPVNGDS